RSMFAKIGRRFSASVSLLCLVAASTSWAATITFKDGYAISGRVRPMGHVELDPGSGQSVMIPSGMAVDMGARVVFFSHSRVLQVEPKDPNPEEASLRLLNLKSRASTLEMYPLVHILEATPWNERWERLFKLQVPAVGTIGIDQSLALMTPQDARVDAKRFAWTSWYLTSEFGPEIVRELLSNHPDLKSKGDAGDFARRMRI